jgi:predicted transcriptional regulator
MSETTQTEEVAKEKTPLALLRERRGGMSDELKEYFKEQQQTRKGLRKALKEGPKTVPELAALLNLEKSTTLWHVMAMRRYGEVVEASERNGYPLYVLKEDQK